MKIVIDIDEKILQAIKAYQVLPSQIDIICEAVLDGTPLPELYDLEGLKSDMKALNCGYPYGLDYLLNCLNNRLGITIIEAESEE